MINTYTLANKDYKDYRGVAEKCKVHQSFISSHIMFIYYYINYFLLISIYPCKTGSPIPPTLPSVLLDWGLRHSWRIISFTVYSYSWLKDISYLWMSSTYAIMIAMYILQRFLVYVVVVLIGLPSQDLYWISNLTFIQVATI